MKKTAIFERLCYNIGTGRGRNYQMKKENNRKLIVVLVIIIIILSVLCVLFVADIISFKSNKFDENNISNEGKTAEKDNTQHLDDKQEKRKHTEEELKGLELYKLMVGNGAGPFEWKNGIVTNYDEIMSRMTKSYIESFHNNTHGFSIPVYEDGKWKSYGGWGTTYESTFKDIKVIETTDCTISYEIIYTYEQLGTEDNTISEGKNLFRVKTCSLPGDVDTDFSTGYKVDNFDLIFGLKFNKEV